MNDYERFIPVYDSGDDVTVRAGQSRSFRFTLGSVPSDRAYRLMVKGETAQFYFWKSEAQCFSQYVSIDDALDTAHAVDAPYCLDMSSDADYPKAVYKKLAFPPRLSYLSLYGYTDEWRAGVFVRAEGLTVREGGYLRVRYEIYDRREGVSPYDITRPCDRAVTLDIPQGSYERRDISTSLHLHYEHDPSAPSAPVFGSDPSDEIAAQSRGGGEGQVAAVCIYIEGEGYRGGLWLESPYVTSSNGYNILPDFAPTAPEHGEMSWIGQNLSRKEWPCFSVSLSGEEFFRGERFERCQRYSEWTADIPTRLLRAGENTLEISLITAGREPLPYRVHEVYIVQSPCAAVSIVSAPETAFVGENAMLIRTARPDTAVILASDSGVIAGKTERYSEAGLHALRFTASEAANDVAFTLSADGHTESGRVARVVERRGDRVLTGSGDLIYINTEDRSDIDEFIAWYFANHIGDMMTLRPVYRWTGMRTINEANWRHLTDILNALGVKYPHMLDGREINGAQCNPPVKMLAGEGFLGRQTHEYDGAYIYWSRYMYRGGPGELAADFTARQIRLHPETTELKKCDTNIFVRGDRHYLYRDYEAMPTDMAELHALCVNRITAVRGGATRHTGPSTAFRCFAEAGYGWVGAELMYGPTELLIALLRGVKECYRLPQIGGHLAVQWSTSPHDTGARYRRYRLALYVCYIQGLDEVNTEEGLWHLEEYYSSFSRNSPACRGHLAAQSDFYRFVSRHERSGELYTPCAFISGRCDGWRSFGRDGVWGNPALSAGEPEDSWELARVFYPLSKPTGDIYLHPCPENRPVGFFTGTPLGAADAVPAESGGDVFASHRALFFVGYNKAEADDMRRLYDYITSGGTLLAGWPHLSVTTARDDVLALRHEYLKCAISDTVCRDISDFAADTFGALPVRVNRSVNTADGEVIEKTDGGVPLVIKFTIGEGTLYFVNAAAYPADKALFPLYTRMISTIAGRMNASEPVGITCGEDVQYTVYRRGDASRQLWLLAVDWYRDPAAPRSASLRLGDDMYSVTVPFGAALKIVTNPSCTAAAYCDNADCEIVSLSDDGEITARGSGTTLVTKAANGALKTKTLDFEKTPELTFRID